MPSFAFWKSAKVDEAKSPLLTNDGEKEESDANTKVEAVVKDLDLDPGNEESGVFLFDEGEVQGVRDERREDGEKETEGVDVVVAAEVKSQDQVVLGGLMVEKQQAIEPPHVAHEDASMASPASDHGNPPSPSPPIATPTTEESSATPTTDPQPSEMSVGPIQQAQNESQPQIRPVSPPPKQASASENPIARPASAALDKVRVESRDRDSGVYLSDDESLPSQSRPASIAANDSPPRSQNSSLSKHTISVRSTVTPERTDSTARRLRRPAELNLGSNVAADPSKPRSELEKRYDLIRNSKTQSKAALRSPTELLKERLNMSPKKAQVEEKVRVFTPPRPIANGCWLPGPGAQLDAFSSTSVRARTEANGRPAWWCKFDKLVVFDGFEAQENGEMKIHTRTSKGLSIARRRGDMETIVIPMDCAHCQEMLNRHEWKYDMQVCKRSVCWDCKERCKWEAEEEKRAKESCDQSEENAASKDSNRFRADSVLQDEQDTKSEMMNKVSIEQDRPMSPIETMGGIEERLGEGV